MQILDVMNMRAKIDFGVIQDGPKVREIWDRQADILQRKLDAYESLEGPQVGDYLILPDGTRLRMTYDWGDTMQTTCIRQGHADNHGGFFMHNSGRCSYSGSLDSGIEKSRFVNSGQRRYARCWFFKDDSAGAGRRVQAEYEARVWLLEGCRYAIFFKSKDGKETRVWDMGNYATRELAMVALRQAHGDDADFYIKQVIN